MTKCELCKLGSIFQLWGGTDEEVPTKLMEVGSGTANGMVLIYSHLIFFFFFLAEDAFEG